MMNERQDGILLVSLYFKQSVLSGSPCRIAYIRKLLLKKLSVWTKPPEIFWTGPATPPETPLQIHVTSTPILDSYPERHMVSLIPTSHHSTHLHQFPP